MLGLPNAFWLVVLITIVCVAVVLAIGWYCHGRGQENTVIETMEYVVPVNNEKKIEKLYEQASSLWPLISCKSNASLSNGKHAELSTIVGKFAKKYNELDGSDRIKVRIEYSGYNSLMGFFV